MYAIVSTRLDISHAVGFVSRYMENLGKEHWATVKWVLRYPRATSDYYITYNGGCELVYGYVDFDFAGDLDKMRGQLLDMSLLLQVDLLVRCQSYITLLRYPLHKHNT